MARKSVLQGRQFKYIKGGMYTLNFFVWVLGLALGSVGIWIRMDFNTDKYRKVLNPVFRLCEEEDHEFEFTISVHMDSISYFLIFVGVSIMATGCVGMCGTKREKATLMAMFFLLLFIIFGILLTAGIKAMVKKDTFVQCERQLAGRLTVATKLYHKDKRYKTFMDQVQKYIGCCGATQGARDYDLKEGPCPCLRKYFVLPCEKAIKDFFSAIEDNMIMTLVVSFSIGIFTLLGMGMSTYLFFALRKAK